MFSISIVFNVGYVSQIVVLSVGMVELWLEGVEIAVVGRMRLDFRFSFGSSVIEIESVE